jgi:hypothetical protein
VLRSPDSLRSGPFSYHTTHNTLHTTHLLHKITPDLSYSCSRLMMFFFCQKSFENQLFIMACLYSMLLAQLHPMIASAGRPLRVVLPKIAVIARPPPFFVVFYRAVPSPQNPESGQPLQPCYAFTHVSLPNNSMLRRCVPRPFRPRVGMAVCVLSCSCSVRRILRVSLLIVLVSSSPSC